MGIRNSNGWAAGDNATDLDIYLHDYASSNMLEISHLAYAICETCAGGQFSVEVDDGEGVAVRRCVEGHPAVPMFDSKDQLEVADLGPAVCPCGGEVFDVAGALAVGSDGEVRWVFVGLRCIRDGVLGCYADWKIDYVPSSHLLDSV